MSRSTQTLLTVLTLACGVSPALACDGGGWGGLRSRVASAYGMGRSSGWQGSSNRNVSYNSYQHQRPYSQPHYAQSHYSQPQYSRPHYSQPQHHQPQPQPQVVLEQPRYTTPSHAAPSSQVIVQRPSATPVSNTTPPQADAAKSALEMLQGVGGQASGIPEFRPATSSSASAPDSHVGKWTARLPNNATVNLELEANGHFRWVANTGGKISTFEGNYTLADARLTLLRSDNQRLEGSWTPTQAGVFNFTVNEAKDGGLGFSRA